MSENAYGARSGGEQEVGTSPASDQEVLSQEERQTPGIEPQGDEQVITPQYLREMEERIVEKVTRRAQSMTDKMGSRLNKEIETALQDAAKTIELGKKAGVKYTPEQEQAIRQGAIDIVYANMGKQEQQSQPQDSVQKQKQDQGNQQNNPWGWVNGKIHQLMGETGVYITADEANAHIIGDNDPETVDPYEYLKAFESLLRQKQQNYRQPQGLNPAVPSFVTGGRSTTSKSALRDQYDKEMNLIISGKHPSIVRGDQMGLQKMKNAYREKGLDI